MIVRGGDRVDMLMARAGVSKSDKIGDITGIYLPQIIDVLASMLSQIKISIMATMNMGSLIRSIIRTIEIIVTLNLGTSSAKAKL